MSPARLAIGMFGEIGFLATVPRLEAIADVGGTPMQGLIAKLSATPGHIRWAGRPLGADQAEVLAELDRDPTDES